MIALLGRCGLERLAAPLRERTGAEVAVTAWNDVALVEQQRPALVYVDLYDWTLLMPVVAAALRGDADALAATLQHPAVEARRAVVQALRGLQGADVAVAWRGLRPPPGFHPPDAGLRDVLAALAGLVEGERVIDVAGLWARHGILDDGVRFGPGHGEPELGELGHSRLSGEPAAAVEARAVAGLWHAARSGPRKCVVVDLDDTLVHGELAADEFSGRNPAWGEASDVLSGPAAELAWWKVPRGMHLALRELQRRGLLLALATRNDPALVARRFKRRPVQGQPAASALGLALDVDDFVVVQAGFGPKSTSCRRIADLLGVGPGALVFVDDRQVERAEVRRNLPEVLVIDGPAATMPWRMLEHPQLQVLATSPAAAVRAASTRSRVRVAATPPEDLAAFLTGLGLVARVRPARDADLPRVRELFARTNQLTLTALRPQPVETEGLLVAELQEQGLDHGLVAAGLFTTDGDQRQLAAWACSCRVLPHQVAGSILWGMQQLEPTARVSREDTGRNAASRPLLEQADAGPAPWVRVELG